MSDPDDAPPDADGEGDSDAAASERQTPDPGEGDGVSRRWLVRLLVALGIGVPVAVEGATFLGLVKTRLFGGGESPDATTTTTRGASVSDELLPETGPSDTLERASVSARSDGWAFSATVAVENTGDAPYTFRVDAVTTEGGTRVAERASTGRIPAGESATLEHTWRLPTGETPAAMTVAGVVHRDGGDETTEREVRLGTVPVSG